MGVFLGEKFEKTFCCREKDQSYKEVLCTLGVAAFSVHVFFNQI